MASGGRLPVQRVPPDHVGAAAREKSHGCPVSETPLDHLVDTDVRRKRRMKAFLSVLH